MEENKQIELRSEKVRNIIGQIPPILITHGTMFIGLALLSLFLAAAFIPYQPTIDTEVTVTQDILGELHYTSSIPSKAINKRSQFTTIITNPSTEIPLSNHFQIETISETIQISGKKAWYVVIIYLIENFLNKVSLDISVIIPAKIRLEKRSVLMWIVYKVNAKT